MGKYEIIYDYEDEKDIVEDFDGDWTELQAYIKQMRQQRCFNISATSLDG